MSPARTSLAIAVEIGTRRTFASALDWPGWCRSGRTEDAALEALAAYAPRFAPVVAAAGDRLPASWSPEVVERLPGSATTDFGAPGAIAEHERRPTTAREAGRRAALVAAAWSAFAAVVSSAPPALRKGPRGGGRDRDAIAGHVLEAEVAYARALGIRGHRPAPDAADAVAALRAAILGVLDAPANGDPPAGGTWPHRYAARRIAWHVLDHAWEIEDRSDGG